jgi:hypothetical protein
MVANTKPVNPVIAINQKYSIANLLWLVVNIQSEKNVPTREMDSATSLRTFQKKINVLTRNPPAKSEVPSLENNPLRQEAILALKKTMLRVMRLHINLPRELAIGDKSKNTSDRLDGSYK